MTAFSLIGALTNPHPLPWSLTRARVLDDVPHIVEQLVARLAESAPQRDLLGGSPKAQRDDLRASGLLSLSIPLALGGLGGSWQDTLQVVRRLARVDSSVAPLFRFHHLNVATVPLDRLPTEVEPVYRSKQDYRDILGRHVAPLSERPQVLFAANSPSVLLNFPALGSAGNGPPGRGGGLAGARGKGADLDDVDRKR